MADVEKPVILGFSSFFIQKTVLLGAVFLWLWLGLGCLLAPIYGWHLLDMGGIITERAELLRSSGIPVHPILSLYEQLLPWDILKAGGLLGMMFLAWPWALVLAIQESLASVLTRAWSRWILRFVTLTLAGLWLWPELQPFLWQPWMSIYALLVLGLFPSFLLWLLEVIRSMPVELTKRRRVLAGILAFGTVLALASHPVWSLWTHPEKTVGLHKIPLIRDFLLLDEKGSDWMNEWYYGSSPLLMERERVTSFQPMMVGVLGVNENQWKNLWLHGFKGDAFGSKQGIAFVTLKLDDEPNVLMRRGVIDYLAVSPAFRPHVKNWDLSEGSYGLYHDGRREFDPKFEDHNSKVEIDAQHYYQKVGQYSESPLTLRSYALRKQGFYPDMMSAFELSKQRFFMVMKEGKGVWVFSVLILLGMVATFVVFMQWLLRVPYAWAVIVLWLLTMSWSERYQFWSHEILGSNDSALEQQTIWSRLTIWHQRAVAKQKNDVESLLSSEFSADSRIFMLQVSVLGRGFETLDSNQQSVAHKKIAEVLRRYHSSSLNVRYKMIDAFAGIKAGRIKLEELLKDERHPYVHWYAADQGLIPKP